MIHFVVFSECIKVFTPYVRKYILTEMDPIECVLLNCLIVFLLCFAVFAFKYATESHSMETTFKRYSDMTPLQIFFAIWIGIATIISSMVVLTMDKHYNTPLINNMLFKVISVFLLLLTGVVIFKERYDFNQILGIVMIICGGGLLFYHTDNATLLEKSKE